MTLSQALEAVNKFYVPGVVGYYAALRPDPWQQAHDDLEKVFTLSESGQREACERFVSRCKELVDRFKREAVPSKGVTAADGFALGNDRAVRSWQSRKGKFCVECEGKTDLTLRARKDDTTQVDIVCRSCSTGSRAQVVAR